MIEKNNVMTEIYFKIVRNLTNKNVLYGDWLEYYRFYKEISATELLTSQALADFKELLMSAMVICVTKDEQVSFMLKTVELKYISPEELTTPAR